MHWCNDETQALLLFFQALPGIGPWLQGLLARFTKPHCCVAEHIEPKGCKFPGCHGVMGWTEAGKACRRCGTWARDAVILEIHDIPRQ